MYYLRNKQDYQKILNKLMPNPAMWQDNNNVDTDLYNLILSIAEILHKRYYKFEEIYLNCIISLATETGIRKYEQDLKLPDEIFDNITDLNIRRKQILLKKYIVDFGIAYKEDIVMLANYLGFNKFDIRFNAKNLSTRELTFLIPSYLFDINAEQFTWIVKLPSELSDTNSNLAANIPFLLKHNVSINKLNLTLKKIKPSYVNIIYMYIL